MRILVATGLYPPEIGGPATHTKLLEEKLPAYGIKVDVVPFRIVRFLPVGVRHLVYAWHLLRRAYRANVLLAQDTISVGLPAALVSRITRLQLIVRVPGDYAWEQGRQRFGVNDTLEEFQTKRYSWRVELLRMLQRFTARSAVRVVVPSEYLERIVRAWGISEEKITLVYNSVDSSAEMIRPLERTKNPLIVTSARLVSWKGVSGLVEVVAREPLWHLLILGEGPLREELEKLVKDREVTERVRFLGSLPHAEALGWYKEADVFVLNSAYEGMSHVLVEAMAQGAPIVAGRAGGNPELIEHEVTGLLVSPNDSHALHDAIQRMLEDKEFARMCGERARELSQRFSSEKVIEQWSRLFHTL